MSDKRLANIETKIEVLTSAILGHDGNSNEGLLAITRKNERDITEMRTMQRTLWGAILAIPVIAATVAFFMPDLGPSDIGRQQQ